MSSTSPRVFTPEQKLKIVLESMQRDTTFTAVCTKYNVAKSVLHRWREQFNSRAAEAVFSNPSGNGTSAPPRLKPPPPGESPAELKRLIGELYMQNDILKKVSGLPGTR